MSVAGKSELVTGSKRAEGGIVRVPRRAATCGVAEFGKSEMATLRDMF
jgi:hypothetical protein